MQLPPEERKILQEILLELAMNKKRQAVVSNDERNRIIDKHLTSPDKC